MAKFYEFVKSVAEVGFGDAKLGFGFSFPCPSNIDDAERAIAEMLVDMAIDKTTLAKALYTGLSLTYNAKAMSAIRRAQTVERTGTIGKTAAMERAMADFPTFKAWADSAGKDLTADSAIAWCKTTTTPDESWKSKAIDATEVKTRKAVCKAFRERFYAGDEGTEDGPEQTM